MIDIVLKKQNGDVYTTSRLIAEKFGKRHNAVLRKIENLPDDEFSQRNFAPVEYADEQGKPRKMYEITRDGFAMVAMSFTGDDAYRWKLDYIKAFNKMERHLRNMLKQGWLEQRASAAIEYKAMSRTLDEVRKLQGKDTKHFHYANEAKLVNWAITGEFKKLDRDTLSGANLKILFELEVLNAAYLGAGHSRETRKALLKSKYGELSAATMRLANEL